jgi:hypothetical protein
MWNGCSEMRERERKQRRKMLNGDKMDGIDMEEEGNNRKERGLELLILYL